MRIAPFTKSYGGKRVVNCPMLELPEGQITAVIGANGSGKSTLARVMANIELPDQNKSPVAGIRVGYIPQKSYAFRMSTARNISLNGKDPARQKELMTALQLDSLAKQGAKKLSGGESAKMALARLLMNRYDLLILDEPTAAMDMESTLKAEALIRTCCEERGCAVLIITHSIQQARRLADQLIFIQNGELLEQGKTDLILSSPVREETKSFLEFYGV